MVLGAALRSDYVPAMDPTLFIILALLVGLAIGAFGGWFAGSRPAAQLRDRLIEAEKTAGEQETEFKRAIAELGQARIEVATLQANAANFDKQIATMKEAREEMLAQFKAVGGEVLSRSQEEFLKRAEERLGHSEKASEEKLRALLAPVGERLKSYEDQVKVLEEKRVDAFGQLAGAGVSGRCRTCSSNAGSPNTPTS